MFCVPDLKEKFDAYYVCCCILFCDLDTFYDLPGEGTRPWYANKGELTKHLVYCTSFQVSNSKNVGGSWKFRFQNPVTSLELVYFYGKTHEIKGGLFFTGKHSAIISSSYPYATHQNLHAINRSVLTVCHNIVSTLQIRRKSRSELRDFQKRWDRAAREDRTWVDPFARSRRKRRNRNPQ